MVFTIIGALLLLLILVVHFAVRGRTRRKLLLPHQEASFLDVFDAIPDVMGIQDRNKVVLRYNTAGYRYLGLKPEEANGRRCYELIGRIVPCEGCATEKAVVDGIPTSTEKYVPETDTWFDVRAYPIKSSRGQVVRVVEHLRDISQEKRLRQELKKANANLENQVLERTRQLTGTIDRLEETQEQLIESEKLSALGRMVSGISHEVNTPLGVAVTSASFMKNLISDMRKGNEIPTTIDRLETACDMVNQNVARAHRLMGGFKQIAADRTSEKQRPVNLDTYIRDIANSLQYERKRANIRVCYTGDTEGLISTYPGAVSQVFTNLMINTIRHAYPEGGGGEIAITYEKIAEGFRIIYSDDGCGMDASTLRRIYEPFFSRSLSSDGIGLGMNIVYNLVVGKLRGQIHGESRPGEGVRFTIDLPNIPEEDASIHP